MARSSGSAFSPVGVEGPFRLACEISLGVMRREKELIMSVLWRPSGGLDKDRSLIRLNERVMSIEKELSYKRV